MTDLLTAVHQALGMPLRPIVLWKPINGYIESLMRPWLLTSLGDPMTDKLPGVEPRRAYMELEPGWYAILVRDQSGGASQWYDQHSPCFIDATGQPTYLEILEANNAAAFEVKIGWTNVVIPVHPNPPCKALQTLLVSEDDDDEQYDDEDDYYSDELDDDY